MHIKVHVVHEEAFADGHIAIFESLHVELDLFRLKLAAVVHEHGLLVGEDAGVVPVSLGLEFVEQIARVSVHNSNYNNTV